MTNDEARQLLGEVLGRIAPGTDLDEIDPTEPLSDELDLDSMDLLSMLGLLHERTGLELPETDAPKLRTLDDAVEYLVLRSG